MQQEPQETSTGLDAARERVADAMVWTATILGAPAVALGVIASESAGAHLLAAAASLIYFLVLVAQFWRPAGSAFRKATLVLGTHLFGLAVLLDVGPLGAGLMWLVGSTVAAAALFNPLGVRIALGAHLLSVCGASWVFLSIPNKFYDFPHGGKGWIASAAGSVFLGGVLSVATGRLLGDLSKHIEELREETRRRAVLEAQLEQRVIERTADLAVANADLERFARAASHDLRSPLQVISGSAELLLLGIGGTAREQRPHVERILAACTRAGGTVRALLALARAGGAPLQRQRVDLSMLVNAHLDDLVGEEAERVVERAIQKGVVADADPDLVTLILQNLLSNAWKFSSTRGESRIEFGVEPGEHGRTYFVRDNGVGFASSEAQQMFQEFARLHRDPSFPGLGLGLATVARAVGRHRGAVWAEGAVGVGAVVRFTLGEEPGNGGSAGA